MVVMMVVMAMVGVHARGGGGCGDGGGRGRGVADRREQSVEYGSIGVMVVMMMMGMASQSSLLCARGRECTGEKGDSSSPVQANLLFPSPLPPGQYAGADIGRFACTRQRCVHSDFAPQLAALGTMVGAVAVAVVVMMMMGLA